MKVPVNVETPSFLSVQPNSEPVVKLVPKSFKKPC